MPVEIPEKLDFLLTKQARYKILYGGRGALKSWTCARALLIRAAREPIRILCAREVQRSIKQSVHTLLRDQIQLMGLGANFRVTEDSIKGINGSEFSFTGLSTNTAESIKSFEGIDIVWVEEGQTVKKRSWDILIPTIRKPGSEIWVSFNPDLDSDDTYVRFVVNPPESAIVTKINWQDNPWFPDVLELERQHCQKHNQRDYPNIWEGHCKQVVEGAIYAQEIIAATEGGRICNVPYDPKLKVHVVFDLGWNDSMFILLVQRSLSEIRVIEAIEDDHKTLDHYSAMLRNKMLNWGRVWLPHDGQTKDFKSGTSAEEILRTQGWDVRIVPRSDVEQGIKVARMAFNRTYFDKTNTKRLVDCLKRYRRSVPSTTGEPSSPMHDEYSHGADCFRYLALSAEQMNNDHFVKKPIKYPELGIR